jgi:predicted TIM-barrel fold metal-dependent hydrolase
MPDQDLKSLLSQMSTLNMVVMVNLSGRNFDIFHENYGGDQMNNAGVEKLNRSLLNVKNNAKGRILVFTNIDFSGIDNPAWTKNAVEQLEKDVKQGAAGLKIYKDLGLEVKDKNGKRLAVDDPRLDPIWEKCGELKIPVLIHTADPKPFWDATDEHNERWLEIVTHPDGRGHHPRIPVGKP